MTFLRRLKRTATKTAELTVHEKLPVGKILSDPIRGTFLVLPIFGWTCRRVKTGTPLVMVTSILLSSETNPTPQGTLQLEYPVVPETELAVLGKLEAFGWDGRVWPQDPGWPSEDPENEKSLRGLLDQAHLPATLIFPPYDSGAATEAIEILRAQGPFLMPPLEPYEGDPDPERLKKFREVYQNPESFFLVSATK